MKNDNFYPNRSEEIIPAGSCPPGLIRHPSDQSEGEQELVLPDVCSESWLTSQTKDGQLSEFISGPDSNVVDTETLFPYLIFVIKKVLLKAIKCFAIYKLISEFIMMCFCISQSLFAGYFTLI